MLLSKKNKQKKKHNTKQTNNKKEKENKKKTITIQTKTATTYNNSRLHHTWRCYQAIALSDQHVGPESLTLLSP